MKRAVRIFVLVLSVAILLCSGTTVALAAPSRTYAVSNSAQHNQAVEVKAAELQQKYNIDIHYPMYQKGTEQVAAISPESLETMDAAFEAVTPQLVRQVSSYYQQLNGRRLSFTYTFADMRGPYGAVSSMEVTVGGFDNRTSRIELYIPRPGEGAVATGDNMMTITHEFGHALHLMITDQYGHSKMQNEWLNLMGGYGFGQGQIGQTVFISEYASTSFEEDFAETFAHAFVCNRAGLGLSNRLSQNGTQTILGRKVAYIENLIPQYLSDTDTAMSNFRKVYTTPVSVDYAGIKLSGTHLQFIGMKEPRSVPLMLLYQLQVPETSTAWVSEIGAWYTTDAFGGHLCIFPDGTYGDPGRSLLAA